MTGKAQASEPERCLLRMQTGQQTMQHMDIKDGLAFKAFFYLAERLCSLCLSQSLGAAEILGAG